MNHKNASGPSSEPIDHLLEQVIDDDMIEELVPWMDAAVQHMMNQTKQMMGTLVGYKELMMMYACAMKEIQTKFDVLTEKLARRGLPFSLEGIETHINDVAGIRVICSYIDDIYEIAEALLRQDDITLVKRKDYIAQPKKNGYRSLHLIVSVPVFFAKGKKEMKVEVQIRTIAMDFWASLEHQLKYKQELPDQADIVAELKQCAEVIHATDEKMLALRQKIAEMADAPTEEDILYDKLRRLDIDWSV